MDANLRTSIVNSYGYDVVDYLNVSTLHNDVKYKYVLLPVYQLEYKYKKKTYTVVINGNSGTVTGKSPVSPVRVIIAVLLGIALFGLFVCAIASENIELAVTVGNLINL